MQAQHIEIIIEPSGELLMDAAGYSGPDCEKATAFLEEALGQITGQCRKPEYYRANRRQRVQKLGQ